MVCMIVQLIAAYVLLRNTVQLLLIGFGYREDLTHSHSEHTFYVINVVKLCLECL